MTVEVDDGRRQWLAELYHVNSAAVFKQCRRLLKDPDDAADATQEIFLRAATSLSEDVAASEAGAWLNTVARNYCIDLIRRRKRFGSALTTLGATADAPVDSVESVEDRELLLAVLPRLGIRERQALWQSAVEDLPLSEIARSLGVSYLAAAQLLHRARRRALTLATRLAIILGLAGVGRAVRRARALQHAQQLAAVVALPMAIGLVVVSSAPPQPPIRAQAQSPPPKTATQRPPPTVQNPAPPVSGALPATGPAPVAAALPAAVLPASTTAVKSGVSAATAKPTPMPAPVDRDKDHGTGRDRDDVAHTPGGGHGK